MPRSRPVRPSASGARFSPNSRSSLSAIFCAPPDTSSSLPSIAPRPTIGATWARTAPIPVSICGTIFATGIPAASATPALTSSNDTNGSNRNRMISSSSSAIPTAATDSR
jgi:hypothetical protein